MGWRFKSSLGQRKEIWGITEGDAFFLAEDGRVEFGRAELRIEGRDHSRTHVIDAN